MLPWTEALACMALETANCNLNTGNDGYNCGMADHVIHILSFKAAASS